MDGERGLTIAAEAQDFFRTQGIQVRPRAPGQHARYIERRGAILRHAMHCIEEQLEREGIVATFPELLAQAVFAGNALISYNGATPYNARFGTQPAVLPDIHAPHADSLLMNGRDPHRVRAVALQRIIESTAQARVRRALRAATSAPGEVHNYLPGDLVDFWRQPRSKDAHAWHGPARVVRNQPERGQVIIRWQNGDLYCKYADVRRFLDFAGLVFATGHCMAVLEPGPKAQVLEILETYYRHLGTSHLETFGYWMQDGKWRVTAATHKHKRVALAADYALRNLFHIDRAFAVRMGKGIQRFPACEHAAQAVIICWLNYPNDYTVHELEGAPAIATVELVGTEWQKFWYLQVLVSHSDDQLLSDLAAPPNAGHGSDGSASDAEADASGRTDATDPDRLSTIDEEPEDGTVLNVLHRSLDDDEIAEVRTLLATIPEDKDLALPHQREPSGWNRPPEQVPPCALVPEAWHFLVAGADPEGTYAQPEVDAEGNAYVEILFPGDFHKLILDGPPEATLPGGCARLRVYTAQAKRAVVERDTDLLTADEFKQHAKAVAAATYEELKIWIDHDCFTRRPRRGARNVLDVRWVGKWKWVKSKEDPSKKVRIIRMRMTLRGFKDTEAEGLNTYAGTTSRVSQRVVTSEAVCRGWTLSTIDVKKAFLKGITYAELAATTNEPSREVNFELKPDAVAILRKFPGYADYDPNTEVLHMLKPGTGCKDAPRCFAIKLALATNQVFGARPSTTDDQLIIRHRGGQLDFVAGKHVDDIKIACSPETRKEFEAALEKVFGKGELDITLTNFTNCGVRHQKIADGYTMDQQEYLEALKPITGPDLTGAKAEDLAPPALAKLFLSLLMALAYTLQTRPDLAIYVIALQRHAQQPKILHVRRLNAVVRWAQRHPQKLTYRHMNPNGWLEVHSDAGFRREEDEGQTPTGRSVRGANFMRLGTSPTGEVCHLLDWHCSSIKVVTRSTFVSELQAAISATDSAIMHALTLHEVHSGPVTPKEGIRLRESGGFAAKIRVCIDAMSVWSALNADRVKPPAEKSLLCHLLWLREIIDNGVLHEFRWVDTRDMLADAHTKGSIPRDDLHSVMSGHVPRRHEVQVLSARGKPRPQTGEPPHTCTQTLYVTVGDTGSPSPYVPNASSDRQLRARSCSAPFCAPCAPTPSASLLQRARTALRRNSADMSDVERRRFWNEVNPWAILGLEVPPAGHDRELTELQKTNALRGLRAWLRTGHPDKLPPDATPQQRATATAETANRNDAYSWLQSASAFDLQSAARRWREAAAATSAPCAGSSGTGAAPAPPSRAPPPPRHPPPDREPPRPKSPPPPRAKTPQPRMKTPPPRMKTPPPRMKTPPPPPKTPPSSKPRPGASYTRWRRADDQGGIPVPPPRDGEEPEDWQEQEYRDSLADYARIKDRHDTVLAEYRSLQERFYEVSTELSDLSSWLRATASDADELRRELQEALDHVWMLWDAIRRRRGPIPRGTAGQAHPDWSGAASSSSGAPYTGSGAPYTGDSGAGARPPKAKAKAPKEPSSRGRPPSPDWPPPPEEPPAPPTAKGPPIEVKAPPTGIPPAAKGPPIEVKAPPAGTPPTAKGPPPEVKAPPPTIEEKAPPAAKKAAPPVMPAVKEVFKVPSAAKAPPVVKTSPPPPMEEPSPAPRDRPRGHAGATRAAPAEEGTAPERAPHTGVAAQAKVPMYHIGTPPEPPQADPRPSDSLWDDDVIWVDPASASEQAREKARPAPFPWPSQGIPPAGASKRSAGSVPRAPPAKRVATPPLEADVEMSAATGPAPSPSSASATGGSGPGPGEAKAKGPPSCTLPGTTLTAGSAGPVPMDEDRPSPEGPAISLTPPAPSPERVPAPEGSPSAPAAWIPSPVVPEPPTQQAAPAAEATPAEQPVADEAMTDPISPSTPLPAAAPSATAGTAAAAEGADESDESEDDDDEPVASGAPATPSYRVFMDPLFVDEQLARRIAIAALDARMGDRRPYFGVPGGCPLLGRVAVSGPPTTAEVEELQEQSRELMLQELTQRLACPSPPFDLQGECETMLATLEERYRVQCLEWRKAELEQRRSELSPVPTPASPSPDYGEEPEADDAAVDEPGPAAAGAEDTGTAAAAAGAELAGVNQPVTSSGEEDESSEDEQPDRAGRVAPWSERRVPRRSRRGGQRFQIRKQHAIDRGETLPVRLRRRSAASSTDPPPAAEQVAAPMEVPVEAPPSTGGVPPTTGGAEAPPTTGGAEDTSMDQTDQAGRWTSRPWPWSSWSMPAQEESEESPWRGWSWETSSPGWWS